MALTDLLTQIADSIRSKDGTTEPIPAMDFPQRILDIPSGIQSPYEVTTGEFVLSEDHNLYVDNTENNFVLNHGIGKEPFMFYVFLDTRGIGMLPAGTISFVLYTNPVRQTTHKTLPYQRIQRINSSANSTAVDNSLNITNDFISIDENKVVIGKSITSANFIFRAGCPYRWIAFIENEV